ncbi:hypothetical protein BGZ65_006978 [Modicella reniformis]|uniref:Uncharacterized protein n=1 Tax=Modicella reniformis TaxID=1440133 RepID=A0A9P6J7G5_9FUNG|nr:hypothetical protein BGZ65_006978 [Modicella reniformis]
MDDEDEELVHLGELIEKNFPEIFAKIKEGDEDLEDASSQSASEGDQDSSEEEQKEDSDNDNESNKSFQGERAGTDNGENSDSEGEGSVAGSERSEITNEQEEEVDLQVDETVTSADNDNSEQELSDQEDSEEQPEQVALIESQEQKSV